MADNEEGAVTAPRGNEWEVVSLTASAYAAAPGPKEVEDNEGNLGGENEAETSNAMFMSGHFVFPPSQHENLPLEPEYDDSQLVELEGAKSDVKDGDNVSIRDLMSDEFPGIQIFDDKGNALSVSSAEFGKDVGFDQEQNLYSTTEFTSFHSEATMSKSNKGVEGEETDGSVESLDQALDSGLPKYKKLVEVDDSDGADLPCEAWWKRHAVSLYANAKEANTLWSIFIAAAVMGLVVIGHQWQHERWKVLHLKWLNDERMGRMMGPLSRFKDVIVGGHRRGSLVRGSTSAER